MRVCVRACVRACMYAYSQTGLTNLPCRYYVTSTEKLQSTLFCRSGWRGSGLGRMNLVDAVNFNIVGKENLNLKYEGQ